MQPYAEERLALSKGRKGGSNMVANDVILRFVEMLMAEKDKNVELRLNQLKQKQAQDEKSNED